MRCEWDPVKDRINRRNQGRFMALGPIRSGLVVVAYTEKDDGVIRIISARRATRQEARMYRTWARS
ncbi:MAG: BrnT family toxin [bacterium]|nr:BrnT family toxin [bacterium]